jgi:hypothetical protein
VAVVADTVLADAVEGIVVMVEVMAVQQDLDTVVLVALVDILEQADMGGDTHIVLLKTQILKLVQAQDQEELDNHLVPQQVMDLQEAVE